MRIGADGRFRCCSRGVQATMLQFEVASEIDLPIERGPDEAVIVELASKLDVPAELVFALLDLEKDFPDMGVWGAKTGLERRVGRIIADAAAGLATNP